MCLISWIFPHQSMNNKNNKKGDDEDFIGTPVIWQKGIRNAFNEQNLFFTGQCTMSSLAMLLNTLFYKAWFFGAFYHWCIWLLLAVRNINPILCYSMWCYFVLYICSNMLCYIYKKNWVFTLSVKDPSVKSDEILPWWRIFFTDENICLRNFLPTNIFYRRIFFTDE